MRLRLIVLLACLAGMLLAAGPAQAVIGGQTDTAHPYVGLVASGSQLCTGTLVGPRHVVTAAHCIAADDGARVRFGLRVSPATPFVAGTAHVHPGFCPGCSDVLGGFATHDLAVIVLDEPVVMPQYGALPRPGAADSLFPSGDVTLVGYGVSAFVKLKGEKGRQPVSTFERLTADARVKKMQEKAVADTHLRLVSKKDGAACFGDSGGPNFVPGTNVVVAINSFGSDDFCKRDAYSYRLDSAAARAFLARFGL
jgi:hypothetical protein